MTLVIILVVALCFFGLAFFTKRRFGILGLGLAAGALLSEELNRNLSVILQDNRVPVQPLSYFSAASILLIVLPSLVLLISGPSYHTKKAAIFGAVAFSLMATMLLLGPLTTSLPTLDPAIKPVLDFIATYQSLLVATAIIIAVVDSWLTHNLKSLSKKRSH